MRFIESICLKDGSYQNLSYHQVRINKTFATFFSEVTPHSLVEVLPAIKLSGTYKVRLIYDSDTTDIEYSAYEKRKIQTIEIIESPPFDYSFKFEDRATIHQLTKATKADEVMISINGMITDGSYANLVFKKEGIWFTPQQCLLNGVKRSLLLDERIIKEVPIRSADLHWFESVSLINAMLDIGDIEIPTSQVSII